MTVEQERLTAGSPDLESAARSYLEVSARRAAELSEGDAAALAARAGAIVGDALRRGGKVMFCGNGGSAADAQHLAAELVGRMTRDRAPIAGLALTTDTSALTAIANDFGFGDVFARQVRALARPGDALVALSTSGRSENVIRAAEAARERDVRVIALVGPDHSALDDLAEVCLHASGETSGLVQQGHITLGHLLCALAERALES